LWKDTTDQLARVKTHDWTTPDLLEAIDNLKQHAELPAKFCFFIDGLDEFDGDHGDLCELLTGFSSTSNFKLCISSRPWNVFEDWLGNCPRLNVHDLTRDDMFDYISHRLESHRSWQSCAVNKSDKESLISDIGTRAEGVFLWVFLVTRSLREGLTNDDDIEELRRRLNSLPTDLESLFKTMLESVDLVYHEQMARILLVGVHARRPLDLDIYAFVDQEWKDPDYAISLPLNVIPDRESSISRRRARRRIDARTRGLLETRDGAVVFLHRTVHDFLLTKEMNDYLRGKLNSSFDPNLSVSKAYIALIKSGDFASGCVSLNGREVPRMAMRDGAGNCGGLLVALLREVVQYASLAENSSISAVTEHMDMLESWLEEIFSTGQAKWFTRTPCEPKLLVREHVLRSDLCDYVKGKLSGSDYLGCFKIPPLIAAFQPSAYSRKLGISMGMLHLLLDHDQNPNEVDHSSGGSTPWTTFAYRTVPGFSTTYDEDTFQLAVDHRLFSKFLAFGANPNAREPWTHTNVFVWFLMSSFSALLREAQPDEYLRSLDVFLDCGADMTAELSFTGFSVYAIQKLEKTSICWWPSEDTTFTPASAFCHALRLFGKGLVPAGMSIRRRRRLLLEVADKIVSKRTTSEEVKRDIKCAVRDVHLSTKSSTLGGLKH
jgi:hypothetical protein